MNMIIKGLITFFMLSMAVPAFATDNTLDDPKAVIEKAVNGILQVLKERADPKKLTEKDRQGIRETVDGRFDYREMARRSVGKAWKKQSPEQQAAFTETFRNLLERSYGNRLAQYHGQIIKFDDAEFKKDKARVKTHIIDTNKTTPVEYRLHKRNHAWQVYDIKIEGVSLVGTFRKDFKKPLKQDGFEGLLQALRSKVAKLKTQDAS